MSFVEAKVPRSMLEKKALYGSPCTRCGLCCYASLCPLARHIFGERAGPCPALVFDAEGSRCGLVDLPSERGPAAKHLIGSGTGCDTRLINEPTNPAFERLLEDRERAHVKQTQRAFAIWGWGKCG